MVGSPKCEHQYFCAITIAVTSWRCWRALHVAEAGLWAPRHLLSLFQCHHVTLSEDQCHCFQCPGWPRTGTVGDSSTSGGRGEDRTTIPIPIILFLGQFQSILPSQAVEICTSVQKNELLAVSSMATGSANQELGPPHPPPGQRASWAPGAGPEGPKGGPF